MKLLCGDSFFLLNSTSWQGRERKFTLLWNDGRVERIFPLAWPQEELYSAKCAGFFRIKLTTGCDVNPLAWGIGLAPLASESLINYFYFYTGVAHIWTSHLGLQKGRCMLPCCCFFHAEAPLPVSDAVPQAAWWLTGGVWEKGGSDSPLTHALLHSTLYAGLTLGAMGPNA